MVGVAKSAVPGGPNGLGTALGGHATRVALFLVIAAGLLAPIWTVRYPPLADYPNHLASAFVLAHLKDPAFHFSQFYRANWNTYPYLTMDAIFLGLGHLMPIELAGRVLLSLSVLSVPAAAWFFLRYANPGEESLAFWSLLVSNNLYFFLYGFLNLQLSLALCLVTVGLWLRYLERPRWAAWGVLLLMTTALYFTHLAGFAVAGVVMASYTLLARRPVRDVLLAALLFIPGMLFYLHAMWGLTSHSAMYFRTFADKAGGLVAVMVGYSPALDFMTLLVIAASLAWARAGNRDFRWNPRWLGAAGILLSLYWLLPAVYRAANVDKRFLPFIFVFALAAGKAGRRGRRLAAVAVLLFLIRAGGLERHFISLQPRLAELSRSFEAIPKRARVLPVADWSQPATMAERHFWAYGVIERGWHSPCLFHDPGVHPLAMRPHAYDPCGQAGTPTTPLDWERVQSEFDYVWAYRVPLYSTSLSSVGTLTLRAGELEVFRLNPGRNAKVRDSQQRFPPEPLRDRGSTVLLTASPGFRDSRLMAAGRCGPGDPDTDGQNGAGPGPAQP
jgi:hypothetical protein